MRFVDTNIFLRFLLDDDKAKASACRRLFERSLQHNEVLVTTPLAIAEVIWVLEKSYKYPRAKIADGVLKILATDNINIDGKAILMESIGLYRIKNIDFIDAFNAVTMLEQNMSHIYSYDTDFDNFPAIHRQEP